MISPEFLEIVKNIHSASENAKFNLFTGPAFLEKSNFPGISVNFHQNF